MKKPVFITFIDVHGREHLVNISYITHVEQYVMPNFLTNSKLRVVSNAGYGTKAITLHETVEKVNQLILQALRKR